MSIAAKQPPDPHVEHDVGHPSAITGCRRARYRRATVTPCAAIGCRKAPVSVAANIGLDVALGAG